MLNNMKKTTDTRITQLKNGQAVMGNLMKNMESIQATMGTCMKNPENNQVNIGTCMQNMETNKENLGASLKNMKTQMGQLAQSLRENPSKAFPSDTEKNLKQCTTITLRSGKELEEPKNFVNEEEQIDKRKVEAKKERSKDEKDQDGVDKNKKEKKSNDEGVSRQPSLVYSTFAIPPKISKDQAGRTICKISKHIQEA